MAAIGHLFHGGQGFCSGNLAERRNPGTGMGRAIGDGFRDGFQPGGSPRDGEAIERRYLNGRYGGIPLLKDWELYGQ